MMVYYYKLRKIGISDLFYNIIKQMYSHTELSVKVDADTCTCTKNVVQLIILNPILGLDKGII